ncbi:MAG: hypothetical protein ACYCZO_03550 [Daejeonella sp.]
MKWILRRPPRGKFGWPVRGGKITGTKGLQTEMTIRSVNVVYDLDGIAQPVVPIPASANAGR